MWKGSQSRCIGNALFVPHVNMAHMEAPKCQCFYPAALHFGECSFVVACALPVCWCPEGLCSGSAPCRPSCLSRATCAVRSRQEREAPAWPGAASVKQGRAIVATLAMRASMSLAAGGLGHPRTFGGLLPDSALSGHIAPHCGSAGTAGTKEPPRTDRCRGKRAS